MNSKRSFLCLNLGWLRICQAGVQPGGSLRRYFDTGYKFYFHGICDLMSFVFFSVMIRDLFLTLKALLTLGFKMSMILQEEFLLFQATINMN